MMPDTFMRPTANIKIRCHRSPSLPTEIMNMYIILHINIKMYYFPLLSCSILQPARVLIAGSTSCRGKIRIALDAIS